MCIIFFVAVYCLVIISVNCRHGECPYGINSLKNNAPENLAVNVVRFGEEDVKEFEKDIDGNIDALREFIATQRLTENQPIYYLLLTNKNPRDPYYITFDKDSLQNSPYNDNDPTVFILHGFAPDLTFYNDGVVGALKEGLLNAGDYNVIFPDFRSTFASSYFQSLRNGYLVAKNISSFLYFLTDNSATRLKDVQLIGLSLGAQMVGNIGEFTPGLGRVTALDPSLPIYHLLPVDMRLSPHDALFVDVIHTNGEYFPFGMGEYRQSGTIDFYVNGGKKQPNCNSTEPISKEPDNGKELLARVCMHDRATDYFVTSMCKGCKYIGVACESYEEFEMGICNKYNSPTAIMGEFGTKPKHLLPGYLKYYVDTDDEWPYCRNNTIPRHFI